MYIFYIYYIYSHTEWFGDAISMLSAYSNHPYFIFLKKKTIRNQSDDFFENVLKRKGRAWSVNHYILSSSSL